MPALKSAELPKRMRFILINNENAPAGAVTPTGAGQAD